MDLKYNIDDLIKKVGNKFLLTTAVSRRALQIKDGDAPLVDDIKSELPVHVAIKEIVDEKIVMGITAQKEMSRSEAIFAEKDDELAEPVAEEPKKPEKKKQKSLTA